MCAEEFNTANEFDHDNLMRVFDEIYLMGMFAEIRNSEDQNKVSILTYFLLLESMCHKESHEKSESWSDI